MSPIKMEKAEKANRLVLRLIEAINHQRTEWMEELLSAECVWEPRTSEPEGDAITGRNRIIRHWKDKFAERLKYSVGIEEMMGSGLRCILFEQIEEEDSDGLRITRREVEIFEVRGEEIIKIRSYAKI